MWFKFSRIILRNRLLILILLGGATLFMGYHAQFVKMSYELAQMLPKTDSTYIEYQQFKSTFGKDGNIIVAGIDDDRLFEIKNFNVLILAVHVYTVHVVQQPIGKECNHTVAAAT